MYITGLHTPTGNFYPLLDPIEVEEENNRLVDRQGYVRAVLDADGEWINHSLMKVGIRSPVKVAR